MWQHDLQCGRNDGKKNTNVHESRKRYNAMVSWFVFRRSDNENKKPTHRGKEGRLGCSPQMPAFKFDEAR